MRRLLAAFIVCAVLSGAGAPAFAGKLDLDIYDSGYVPPRRVKPRYTPRDRWVPGDPRDQRGEPRWVQYTSHLGYAGLATAGLVGCLATGGVAPAVGFGIVTVVQLWQAWGLHKTPANG